MSLRRDCRPIPPEIRQHCAIYFEEKTYTQAATLLSSLLVSNTSSRHPLPAFVPASSVLALLATVLVHPSTTTRAQDAEARTASSAAHHYLRTFLAQCSPSTSRLTKALSFARTSRPLALANGDQPPKKKRRSTNGTNTPNSAPSNTTTPPSHSDAYDSDEAQVIHNSLFGSVGLYKRAESFWSVVGWAFICSVQHKHRWAYWKHWLSLTLDVIDTDWEERVASLSSTKDGKQGDADTPNTPALEDSLAAHYLLSAHAASSTSSKRTAHNHILRAILATSSHHSTQEFPEIWKGETKRLKPVATTFSEYSRANPKRKKLDLDEGQFGDYGDEAEDEDEDEVDVGVGAVKGERTGTGAARIARGKRNAKRRLAPGFTDFKNLDLDKGLEADGYGNSPAETNAPNENQSSIDEHGGHEALVVRRRLLALFLRTTLAHNDGSSSHLEILTTMADALRPLPPSILAFLARPAPPTLDSPPASPPSTTTIPPATLTTLTLLLLRTLSATNLPSGFNVSSMPTISTLVTHLLPYAASSTSVSDQARVAIALETLLRLYLRGEAGTTDAGIDSQQLNELNEAVRKGAAARRVKVERARAGGAGKGRGKGVEWKASEEKAAGCLRAAETGLRLLASAVG